LGGAVPREVAHEQRPRADEGELAPEHVEELRQLIERRGAEKLPHGGEPLGVGQRATVGAVGVAHRTKLHHPKHPAAEARALLGEEHG
jgi:hypothetical protein